METRTCLVRLPNFSYLCSSYRQLVEHFNSQSTLDDLLYFS